MKTPNEIILARIQQRVSHNDAGCLIWYGSKSGGYGVMRVDNKLVRVHRFMCEYHHGAAPSTDNLVVRHACDVRNCVEPSHLSWGTYSENTMDFVSQGRVRGADKRPRAARYVSVLDRIFHHTAIQDNGCCEWVGYKNTEGYASIVVDGKRKMVHRLVYENIVGPIPEGMVIRHTCDNPPCCNPEHLLIGTAADNVCDSIERGRSKRVGPAKNRTVLRGALSPSHNLDPQVHVRAGERLRALAVCGEAWSARHTQQASGDNSGPRKHPTSYLGTAFKRKVDPEDVRSIVGLCQAGQRQRDVAEMFNISRRNVQAILSGETWSHLFAAERETAHA